MITLTDALENFMQGQDLKGLKPFAYLFRNKWVADDESESESAESGSVGGKYVLDTTPIDITPLIVKPNTLSMTLDVNEVAQYNANNVTLTLSDTHNYFVEGTPESYFPEGYQLYGSRVVLYYGIDDTNRTAIFTGRIKELPTYKPEQYQVELKLVSPLEMLKDIEAKDFSDKVICEELNFVRTEEQKRIYETSGTGVGGFDAIYADGAKLYEGIDYELDQMNALNLPAVVTIINEDYEYATITADYYTWKTGLSVEQIIAGLVALAGYTAENTDIRSVVWNNQVRAQRALSAEFTLGYKDNANYYTYTGNEVYNGGTAAPNTPYHRYSKLPTNFEMVVSCTSYGTYFLGDLDNGEPYNGVGFDIVTSIPPIVVSSITCFEVVNGVKTTVLSYSEPYAMSEITITRSSGTISLTTRGTTVQTSASFTGAGQYDEYVKTLEPIIFIKSISLKDLDTNNYLDREGIYFNTLQKNSASDVWAAFNCELSEDNAQYLLQYRTSNDGATWSSFNAINIGAELGLNAEYVQFLIQILDGGQSFNVSNAEVEVLTNALYLQLVNLSGLTILEALQDFALISGYEFGVDRNGIFFFRPRVASTAPKYVLGESEVVKVDTIKKNLSDLFTKLTLNFAQIPLEFYANDGPRPNAIDKYGVINKEIDKPDIVNYDNPELAQAIGPQLLAIYADLSNILQVTGKLNLSLELGDIVNLKRNYNLVQPDSTSDLQKYAAQQTYYRACKITGMNYNFAKRQITYTLRDVSNANNGPLPPYLQFTYEFPLPFGAKQ